MVPEIKKRVDEVIKQSLADLLKRHGFQKRGSSVYARPFGEVLHMIDVQHSRWNNPEKRSFTINCGVYIPGVVTALGNLPEPKQVMIPHCCVNIRVGHLRPSRLDLWWEVSAEDAPGRDAQIQTEIVTVVNEYVLPFLDQFQTVRAVAELLTNPQTKIEKHATPPGDSYRLVYAAVLWRRLGELEKSSTCIDEAVRRSKKKPGEDLVAAFAARFRCDTRGESLNLKS